MSKVLKSDNTGLYFVRGLGFTGTVATATRFDDENDAYDTQDCAENMGLGTSSVLEVDEVNAGIDQNEDGTSWAVNYVRKQDANGGVKHNDRNPSPRRFKTREEAEHHARRFVKVWGHVGFWVTKTNDPVNAWVNKITGKTNPEIGAKRAFDAVA